MNEARRLGQLGVLIYLLRTFKRRGFDANLVAEVSVDLLCRCPAIFTRQINKNVELVSVSFYSTAVVRFQRGHQMKKVAR